MRVTVYEREERVCVEISDDGEGIDPERQARIFDPFFSSKEPGEGTGLGLAVCHGIIEGAGGTIEVVSAPGCGATFTVVMPRHSEPGDTASGDAARTDDVAEADGINSDPDP